MPTTPVAAALARDRRAPRAPRAWRRAAVPLLLLAACAPLPPPPPPGPEAVEVQRDVGYLADPARQGRQLGTAGRDSAAAWIARRMEAAGLRPLFEDPCPRRDPCPGLWGRSFRVPSWAVPGTGVNVAGFVPGSDPVLRGRYIIVGAHYDHVGRLAQYTRDPEAVGVRPGADDNASGTAAMLELARRVGARPLPATVVFVAFDAEELGLFGSRHFVADPPVPLDSVVAMLNLDMVGRMRADRLTVRGTASAPWWADVVTTANTDSVQLRLERAGGASDHVSFRERRIPALHFYTGTHADYHRRTDRVNTINFHGLMRVVDIAERVLRRLADPELR